jgi:hypothetical protein
MDGVMFELTTIATGLLVAVKIVAQDALLKRSQVMMSPLSSEEDEKVLLPLPVLIPFNFH